MKIGPERLPAYRAIVFITAIIAALLAYALSSRAPLSVPEMKASDVLSRLSPRPLRTDIAIVALDGPSAGKYGPIEQWPRDLLAQALSKVESAGAKVVAFDLSLETRKPGDEALWRAMANNRNVVLGMAYAPTRIAKASADDTRALVFLERDAIADNLTLNASQTQMFTWQGFDPPVSDYTGSARGAGVFIRETDPDGVLRDARLIYTSRVDYTGMPALSGAQPQSRLADGVPVALPNLALVTALRVFGLDKESVRVAAGDSVRLAGNLSPSVNIPVDYQGHMRIRFASSAADYTAFSFADIVTGKVKPDLRGKTVLFGATAPGDPATQFSLTPAGLLPRVDVTASALQTLLDRSYVDVVAVHAQRLFGVLLLVGLIVGICLMLVSGARSVVVGVILAAVYVLVAWGLYGSAHVMLPLLPALLVLLLPLLVALALYAGPFAPQAVNVSPTYVAPPREAVRDMD